MGRAIVLGLTGFLFCVATTISAQTPSSSRSDCDGCGTAQRQKAPARKKLVTIVGVLTNEGIECQALRADDGTLYTLTGRLRNFKPGDRVQVVGEIAEFSFCQQGITINVRCIRRA